MSGAGFLRNSKQDLQLLYLGHGGNEVVGHDTRLVSHCQRVAHQCNAYVQMTGYVVFD